MRGENPQLSRSRKNKNRKPTENRKPLRTYHNVRTRGCKATSQVRRVRATLCVSTNLCRAKSEIWWRKKSTQNEEPVLRGAWFSKRRNETSWAQRNMVSSRVKTQLDFMWRWNKLNNEIQIEVILSCIISHMWNQIIVPPTSALRSKVCVHLLPKKRKKRKGKKGRQQKVDTSNGKTTMWNSPFGPVMEQYCG